MPIKSKIPLDNNSTLYIWELTESYSYFESKVKLSEKMMRHYNSISSDKRKREWLTSKFIIQNHFSERVEMDYEERKLILKNFDIKISISHNDLYCCVLISNFSCGVDVESKNRNFEKVSKRFLSDSEQKFISGNELQCISWCAKEALYKAIEEDEIDFRDDFIINNISNDMVVIDYMNSEFHLTYFTVKDCIVCYLINN